VLEVEHNRNNFEILEVLEEDQGPFNIDLYRNLNVNAILKRNGYFTGTFTG